MAELNRIILLTLLGLITKSSSGSATNDPVVVELTSQQSETNTQLIEMKSELEKLKQDLQVLSKEMLQLVSLLSGRGDHTVEKREELKGNFPYGRFADIRGPPGKDGADGVGLPGKDGSRGPPGPPGPPGPQAIAVGGAVYSRWGRTTCGNNSILLYKGFAGGSNHDQPGGGVNMQCMPLNPQYNKYYNGVGTWYGSFMAGVEYETYQYGVFPNMVHNQNMPCARCYTSSRAALMMIPANRECAEGWTLEYEGYLMAQYYNHNHQTTFECVDSKPEFVHGGQSDTNGGEVHFIRPQCDRGGHCPPYDANKELTCVVCSK